MSGASFQRARSPAQQEQRRAQILAAARELLSSAGPAAVSLRELARSVNLAKSNVVRYFPTREAVFLAVLAEDLQEWLVELRGRLPHPAARRRPAIQRALIAAAVAECLAGRPRLCELVAACQSVLEQNVPAATAREFKTVAQDWLTQTAALVHAAGPGFGRVAAAEFAGHLWALVVGVWPMANPNPVVASVLAEPEYQDLAVDFPAALSRALTVVLEGLAALPAS